jgi:GNAT superfamily N-acetyltransferase
VLVIADEFASGLDGATASVLCRQVRDLVSASQLGLLLATPRSELMGVLRPDAAIVKAIRQPPVLVRPRPHARRPGGWDPRRWRIVRGSMRDYGVLAGFHYVAGPPAAHKRVYVIRPPRRLLGGWSAAGAGDPAAVLVVSPPLLNVRGRNLATGGRYAGADRAAALDLLNREVECVSRVIVHPMYRGCGLAVRLVRHAIARAEAPLLEALAAMGRIHPFFERAGMKALHLSPDGPTARLLSAADAVGLSRRDLASVRPVERLLARGDAAAGFLRAELHRYRTQTDQRKRRRPEQPGIADLCRRAARQVVYYLAQTGTWNLVPGTENLELRARDRDRRCDPAGSLQ